jgi:rhodanese-related sulfurtransferase
MKLKVNLKIVFVIIIVSALAGLIFNSFYSKGIPCFRKERLIKWEKDSALQMINSDSALTISKSADGLVKEKEKGKKGPETGRWKTGNGNEAEVHKVTSSKNVPVKPSFITLKQAYKLYRSGNVLFIDARDKWEFADGHISGAINIPEYNFDKSNPVLKTIPKNKTIVSYCDGDDCEMSVKLADNLFNLGYEKVYIFFGGWKEWKKAGYDMTGK